MNNPRWARSYFAVTAFIVTFGLALQVVLAARSETGSFGSATGRVFNFFCFFTVQSNVLVAITTGLLALRLDRPSQRFAIFRLDAVIAIAITGVVFHLALKNLQELTGWNALADFILHTMSPLLTVLGWLCFGPRGMLSPKVARRAVAAPACWLLFTFVRGTFVQDTAGGDYYPYPFLNVQKLGYATVSFNALLVAALFLVLCIGAGAADQRLGRT